MRIEDRIIFNEIRQGNKAVYEALFSEYYQSLVRFAESYLFDQQESEDLVQDLFIYIWENAQKVQIHTSIKAYFYQSIRNRCINYLKGLKVKDKKHLLYLDALMNAEDNVEFFDPELLRVIKDTVDELPTQMSKVFRMKLIQGMKREEIAKEMEISVNTVKTHLKRAKEQVREKLHKKTSITFLL